MRQKYLPIIQVMQQFCFEMILRIGDKNTLRSENGTFYQFGHLPQLSSPK